MRDAAPRQVIGDGAADHAVAEDQVQDGFHAGGARSMTVRIVRPRTPRDQQHG
jgi:hypothetical protein